MERKDGHHKAEAQSRYSVDFSRKEDNASHSIKVYTTLCLLKTMKHEIGLEAMLEYMDKYLDVINKSNPKLHLAAAKAMSLMNIKKIYADAM